MYRRRFIQSLAGACSGVFVCSSGLPQEYVQKKGAGASGQSEELFGLIWMTGSVTADENIPARIDLGEAHGLREGQSVAILRPVDTHFSPVGGFRISRSEATWSVPAVSGSTILQQGDRVLAVRTLTEVGTAEDFQDKFLAQQIVRTADSNGYSTLRLQEEADTLQRLTVRQPRWQRDQKRIAGTIRAESVSAADWQAMQPVLNQVLKFQQFRDSGIPIRQTIGLKWERVLRVLTPRRMQLIPHSETAFDSQGSLDSTDSASVADQPASAEEKPALENRIDVIRGHVNRILFLRSDEERNVVTMLCTVLEVETSPNDRQWISRQLAFTQFADLADDIGFLDDFEAILKAVRNQNS